VVGAFLLLMLIAIVAFALLAQILGPMLSMVILGVLMLIILSIPITFFNVMISVIYYSLREVKEGVSVDSLASVFD